MNSLYDLRLPISVYFQNKNFQLFQFSIFTEFSLPLHKLGFFRFLRRQFPKYFEENLAVTSSFQFRYIFQYFRFFLVVCFSTYHQNYVRFISRLQSNNKRFLHDDSRCCLVIYILAILCFPPDILSQEFDSMIYKSFSGVENVIPILLTSISQWASLSLD